MTVLDKKKQKLIVIKCFIQDYCLILVWVSSKVNVNLSVTQPL